MSDCYQVPEEARTTFIEKNILGKLPVIERESAEPRATSIVESYVGADMDALSILSYAADQDRFDEFAEKLEQHYKDNLKSALEDSSHVRRLLDLGLERDIDFCLKFDAYKVIPVYKGEYITKMKLSDMLL